MKELKECLELLDDISMEDLKAKYICSCTLLFSLILCVEECTNKKDRNRLFDMWVSLTKQEL